MENNTYFVNNQVNIKQADGENVVVFQKVSMINQPNAHAFDFIGEFANQDGSDKVEESIFSVDDNKDGSYSINLNKLDIFKDGEGKSLSDIFPQSNGVVSLKMTPGESAISMSSNGEELVFNFKGTDGKDYTIKTDSLGVSVEYDGRQYNYSTNKEYAVGVNITPKTLEDFLDKNNTICKTPNNITKEIPSYLFGLYGSLLRGNSQKEMGDFIITSINPEEDQTKQPYIFVTKTTEDKTTSNFLYVDGVLKKCNNFLLQYQSNEGSAPSPVIVIEATSRTSKKGSLPNPKYYGIPAIVNENGKISANSKQAIEFLSNIATYKESKGNGEVPFTLESEDATPVKFNFFKKDERAYTTYNFRIKTKTISRESQAEDSTEIEKQPPVKKKAKKSSEKNDAVVESDDEEEKTRDVDISKYVETYSTGGCYLGLGLMILAIATGLAPLMFVGAGIIVTGIVGVSNADFFKYKLPVRKAKKKISEYEKMEIEDAKFAENFAIQEKTLEQTQDLSEKQEATLGELLHDDASPLKAFTDAYNTYGVGFEGMLEGDERVNNLIGFNGFERKVAMTETLNQISKAKKAEQRTELINTFIHQNFEFMPPETEREVRKIFDASNKDSFNKFVRSMNNTVTAQRTEKKIFDAQVQNLAESRDGKIIKTFNSPRTNPVQRKTLFERYSNTIVRHYMTSNKTTFENINRVVEKLPYEEKTVALECLNEEAQRVDNAIANITEIAKDNRAKVKKAHQCSHYIATIIKLDKKKKFATYEETKDSAKKLMLSMTAMAHKPQNKDKKALAGIVAHTESLRAKLTTKLQKEIATQIIEILNMNEYPPIEIAYRSIIETAEREGLLESVVDHYLNNTTLSILPDLNNIKTSKEYSLETLAEKLGNDSLKEKLRLYNECRQAQIVDMGKKMGVLVEKLEQLDASVGFNPPIDSIEINEEVKKMKRSNSDLNVLDEDLLKKVAVARLKAKEIQTATTKDSLSEEVVDLYGQFDEMTNLTVSGRLTNLAVDNAVRTSIGIETDIATKTLKIQSQELKTNLENYNTTIKVVNDFAGDDKELKARTEKVIETFKTADANANEKALLKKAFMDEFGLEYLDPNLTFNDVVAKLTEQGKIDPTKATKFINDHIKEINEHTKTNLHTMDNVLGEEFIDDEFARRKTEIENGKDEQERYNSKIEILTRRFGLAEDKIREEVAKGNTSIDDLLKKFNIKPEDYSKHAKNVRENGFSDETQLEIWKKEGNLAKLKQQCQDFDTAWELAVHGDSTKLQAIIKDKNYAGVIKKLGINVKSIQTILNQKADAIQKASLLDNLDQKDKITSRSTRILSVEEAEIERFKEENILPTKGDKALFIERKKQQEFENDRKEFLAKVNAILKKGYTNEYSPELIEQAFASFVKGDVNFFLEHPEILCDGNFDFSENDPILLKKLGIKPKDLTNKKKRNKKLMAINKRFKEKSKSLAESVEKRETENKNQQDKGNIELNKVSETKVKDNLSIIEKVFGIILEKHKQQPPPEKEEETEDESTSKQNNFEDEDEMQI